MKLVKEFFKDLKMRGYANKTVSNMTLALALFDRYITPREIKDITPDIINEYKTYLSHYRKKDGSPLHSNTIFNRLNALRKYFQFLKREKQIFYDPTVKLEFPKMKRHLPKNILTEEEVLNLLSQPNINTPFGLRDRAILEVLYSSALRRQELVNLNLYDIDTDRGIIRVIKGKGGKDRTVPVGKIACKFVNRYIKEARSRLVKDKNEKALFINKEKRRMPADNLGEIIQKYSQRIGKSITCHSLRHACATHMLRGGAPIRYIQELLGHSSLETTQVYTRVAPVDLKKVIKKCHPRGMMRKKE